MFLYKITKKGGYVSVKAKKVLKIILIILLVAVLIVGGYIIYVMIDYHRIEDNQALQINDVTSESALVDQEYKAISYNIGFAAYTPDFGFFMDGGTKSRANSEESVKSVIDGIGDFLKSENPDIILIEEVDKKATRSYHYDQDKALRGKLDGYDSMFTVNFDSPYLFYPITKPHGKSYAGMLTLSKFNIESGLRHSLPIENGFMKFVDLDRCYSVSRITVENGKELVLYTLHLSAYTSDGTNYTWAQPVDSKLFDGTNLKIVAPYNEKNPIPSCRNADGPYNDKQFVLTVDGFIVSDNVTVTNSDVYDLQFKYSDHNPVYMTFKLNK